ncbi:hypothetical protein LIER_08316 [Lithospermum erythrorhizon]|uniref:Uncharacterized protein n=1 Tax=Lithospermum erythrorhizon TaxID=34254 RepID=A0AAV3PBP1_LITER
MCTDFINLNKACPNDYYPLPYLGRLVDESAAMKFLTSSMRQGECRGYVPKDGERYFQKSEWEKNGDIHG